jgi:serine/arginine repetitive matrix protein 1
MEDPRPSNDSADRPYEHWYRGEAARNGGVGELKIGRKEMLDIAQFGHASTNPQRSSPLAFNTAPTGIRRRAESFDAGAGSGRESFENKRESWIMDEKAAGFGKVIDETPLTDLDADEYTTEGERAGYYSNGSMEAAAYKTLYERVGLGIAGSHQDEEMEDAAYEEGDGDTTMVYSTTPKGKSALASRPQASALPATAAPTGKTPLGTNNGATGAKNALLSKPGGPNKPNKANAAAVKGKAAAARGKTLPGAKGDTAADEMGMGQENQGGVPLEKIPYKRPPAKGNWDDIVLPAVAKKLGVEGYALRNEGGAIETIDEEARKRMSMIQPPVSPYSQLHLDILSNLVHRSLVYSDTIFQSTDLYVQRKISIWVSSWPLSPSRPHQRHQIWCPQMLHHRPRMKMDGRARSRSVTTNKA